MSLRIVPVVTVLVVCCGTPVTVAAQTYPSKAVRIVAASSPGSGVDIIARVVGQRLAEGIGQQVIVDNRAGAGGNLGAEVASKSPPDGYTLFMGTPAHAINATLTSNLTYNLVRDFSPISLLTTGHYMLVVHPSVPAKSVKELIALARVRPGQLNYGSAGNGNATHLAGELFNSMAGVRTLHVPYKGGGPAKTDLIAGRVDLMFNNITSALPDVQNGRLRALAVTGPRRALAAPQVPTVSESGLPGYELISWFGVLAPAGTPADIISRLNREFVRAVNLPDVKERLGSQGAEAAGGTPQQFADHIKSEISKLAKVIKDAGIRAQ
jgi:tripartite-type tricarboxylate transporter receptor subunit TctC